MAVFCNQSWIIAALLCAYLACCACVENRGATNQLPSWRIQGEIRQWSAPSPSTTRRNEDRSGNLPSDFVLTRQIRFDCAFSEGGQWHMQTLSSVDQYSQLREFSCDRGDLFGVLREAGGTVTIDQERVRFVDSAEINPGPIRFSTSYMGALWWLFCSRYARQGEQLFAVPDFMDGAWDRPVYCQQMPARGGLGLLSGSVYFEDPSVFKASPRFKLQIDQVAQVEGVATPVRARVEKLAPTADANGIALISVQEILCSNVVGIPHPETFRPRMTAPAGVIEERVPLWRVTYVGTNWLSLDDLQKRVESGKGVKADFLGRTVVQPRARVEGPVF